MATSFKKLVDEHGVPVFLKIVFPEAVKEMRTEPKDDAKTARKSKRP